MKTNFKLLALLGLTTMLIGCNSNPSTNSSTNPSINPSTPSNNKGSSGNGGDSSGTSDSEHDVDSLEPGTVNPDGTSTGDKDAKGKFYSDYGSFADEQKSAKELAIDIAAEGDTLLKNADNASMSLT